MLCEKEILTFLQKVRMMNTWKHPVHRHKIFLKVKQERESESIFHLQPIVLAFFGSVQLNDFKDCITKYSIFFTYFSVFEGIYSGSRFVCQVHHFLFKERIRIKLQTRSNLQMFYHFIKTPNLFLQPTESNSK